MTKIIYMDVVWIPPHLSTHLSKNVWLEIEDEKDLYIFTGEPIEFAGAAVLGNIKQWIKNDKL